MNKERNCSLCQDYEFSPDNFKNFLWERNLVLYESYPIMDWNNPDRDFIQGFKNCLVCVHCQEELPTIDCAVCKNGKLKAKDLSPDYLDYEEIELRDNGDYVDGTFCIKCYRVLGWNEK